MSVIIFLYKLGHLSHCLYGSFLSALKGESYIICHGVGSFLCLEGIPLRGITEHKKERSVMDGRVEMGVHDKLGQRE